MFTENFSRLGNTYRSFVANPRDDLESDLQALEEAIAKSECLIAIHVSMKFEIRSVKHRGRATFDSL